MALLVNGELVDDAVIRQEAQSLRPRYEAEMDHMEPVAREIQLREWARENVIEKTLLRQEALRDPQPVPAEEIERALEDLKRQAEEKAGCGLRSTEEELRRDIELRLRLDRLVGRVAARVSPPKRKDVGDFYKKNKEQFATSELIRACHIVKNVDENCDEATARQAIETAQAELSAGRPFAEVADRFSDCAGNGGDLGWFPRGEMVEEFEREVFDLPEGKLSSIFRSVFGFHIAMVTGRRPAGVRPFADVKEQIEQLLWREKQERALEQFVDHLKAKAEIRDVRQPAAPVTSPVTA